MFRIILIFKIKSDLIFCFYIQEILEYIVSNTNLKRSFNDYVHIFNDHVAFFTIFSYFLNIFSCASAWCADLFLKHFLSHRLYKCRYLIIQVYGRYSILKIIKYLQFDLSFPIFSLSMVSYVHVTRCFCLSYSLRIRVCFGFYFIYSYGWFGDCYIFV